MKAIVITGVTSGFGMHWLYKLDKIEQAVFFVLARNKSKFNQLISGHKFNNNLQFIECDLSSFHSIKRATDKIKRHTKVIDVLINNAGVWSSDERPLSEDGIELTLAVNHLAPYMLIGLLLELIMKSDAGRIVNTASFRYSDAKIDQSDIELKKKYSAEQAYCNSKLYSILFTKKLASLISNSSITVNCFDPGIVDTPMLYLAFPRKLLFLYPIVRRFFARTPDKGAETGVFLSTSSRCKDVAGEYFKDFRPKKTNKTAHDTLLSDWLWAESERLTGLKFIFNLS